LAEDAERLAGHGADREHGRLAPQDRRGRYRRHGHRPHLDVGVRRVAVDLQEHVADAQRRALAVGDDDFNLFHTGHPGGDARRCRRIYG
jgi:hypothetical protein